MTARRFTAIGQPASGGLLLVTAAAALWWTIGVATKLLPDGSTVPSLLLRFGRLATAAPLLALFSAFVLGRALRSIAMRDVPSIAPSERWPRSTSCACS